MVHVNSVVNTLISDRTLVLDSPYHLYRYSQQILEVTRFSTLKVEKKKVVL